jgi:hypothetical protein
MTRRSRLLQRLALSRGAGLPDNSRASELDRKKREAA